MNTPTKARGIGAGQASDLRWIEASARQVAACAQGHTIVVEKSTLPVRTARALQAHRQRLPRAAHQALAAAASRTTSSTSWSSAATTACTRWPPSAVVWHRDGKAHCGARFCVWPPADFVDKADTNDTREPPAIRICRDLLEEGAQLAIFDPKASTEQIAADLGGEQQDGKAMQGDGVWQAAADPLAAVRGADAVVLLTEWEQFRQLDWPALAAVMRVWVVGEG